MNVRLERRSLSRIALKPVCRRGAMGICATMDVLMAESRRDKIRSERGERKERNDGLIVLLWHGSTDGTR
jgi:hypothetical protein